MRKLSFPNWQFGLGLTKAGVYKYLPTQGYAAYWKSQQVVQKITHVAQATAVDPLLGKRCCSIMPVCARERHFTPSVCLTSLLNEKDHFLNVLEKVQQCINSD